MDLPASSIESYENARRPWLVAVLAGVIVVALALRLWGVNYGLPYLYHPDEPNYVRIAQGIFKTGDLNPHFFNYPSLFLYANALAYVPYYLAGKAAGIFRTPADIAAPATLAMGSGQAPMPSTFLLGRGVSVAFGAATVLLVALMAWRLSRSRLVTAGAGLLAAVAPVAVANSRHIAPDATVTFFVVLTVALSLALWETGRTRYYLVAGLGAGLAASAKYNGGLVLVVPLLAHFLRPNGRGLTSRGPWLTAVAALAGFLGASPFVALDFATFRTALAFEGLHYSTGHAGMEGDTLAWYLRLLWQTEGPAAVLAVVELGLAALARDRRVMLVCAFPVVYFVFISGLAVRNDRTLLLLIPLLVLAAALLPSTLGRLLPEASHVRLPLTALCYACLALTLLQSTVSTVASTQQLTAVDGRELARTWIESHFQPGTRLAVESYVPYVSPDRYQVLVLGNLTQRGADWYRENGIQHLIFSQGTYGRFFVDPARYAAQVQQYQALWAQCGTMMTFPDGAAQAGLMQVRICDLSPS